MARWKRFLVVVFGFFLFLLAFVVVAAPIPFIAWMPVWLRFLPALLIGCLGIFLMLYGIFMLS